MAHLLHLFLEERDRWFFWLPLVMVGGIVTYFNLPFEPPVMGLVASPVLAVILFFIRKTHNLFAFVCVPFFFILGLNAAQLETRLVAAPMLDEDLKIGWFKGYLVKTEPTPDGTRLLLKYPKIHDVKKENTPLYMRVKTKDSLEKMPQSGSLVSFWGPVWPLSEPFSPRGYDFRRRFFFDSLGATSMSYGDMREHKATKELPFFWDGFHLIFERARRFLMTRVRENIDGATGAMTAALLSGLQTGIDQDVMKSMRISGLSHLLSISGIHVSMMGLLVYIPLRALLALFPFIALRFPIKKWAALAAIAAAFLYTLLVGPETPTIRSALMMAIVLLAVIVDKRSLSVRLVVLSALLLLFIVPSDVMGPSFEMSFAAVLAMVVAFEKRLDKPAEEKKIIIRTGWIRTLARSTRDILLTSIVATIATAPFTLYHFGVFSFYGVISNMIALPLTSFWIMPCILLTYMTAPFGLDYIFLQGTAVGVGAIIDLANEVASWPYAIFAFPSMPAWVLSMILVGGFWLLLWRRQWRYWGVLPMVIGFCYPFYITPPDIFISETGKQWAVRVEDQKFVTSAPPWKFLAHSWRQEVGTPWAGKPEFITRKKYYLEDKKKSAFDKTDKALVCSFDGCLYQKEGKRIAFLKKEKAFLKLCGKVDLIVAPFDLSSCPDQQKIGLQELTQKGAQTIVIQNQEIQIKTAREAYGTRPWSKGWQGFN